MDAASTPWFRDLPLQWDRGETNSILALFRAAYKQADDLLELAQNSGLDIGGLDQGAKPKYLVREILEKARRAERLERLLVEVLNDPELMALHQGIRESMRGWEAEFHKRALERRPSLSVLGRMQPDVAIWGANGPETVLNAMAAFADPAVFRQRLAECEVRVAQVVGRGKPLGTGFLVGERHLLTNWHVVAKLQGAAGADGAAVFDHKRAPDGRLIQPGRSVAFADRWLLASSDHDREAAELSANGPAAGLLDYALIELSEPVGSQGIGAAGDGDRRRWYKLGTQPRTFSVQEALVVLGHPFGAALTFAYASPANASLLASGARVRYGTNTAPGSSGSPVLDQGFGLVALHHFGGVAFNQGIPIFQIAADLRAKLEGQPVLAALGLGS